MEIGDKILTGITTDWLGQATKKYHIIDETLAGKFVCEGMPEVVERLDGSKSAGRANSKYVCSPMTSLFLRNKSEFSDIKEEIIGG